MPVIPAGPLIPLGHQVEAPSPSSAVSPAFAHGFLPGPALSNKGIPRLNVHTDRGHDGLDELEREIKVIQAEIDRIIESGGIRDGDSPFTPDVTVEVTPPAPGLNHEYIVLPPIHGGLFGSEDTPQEEAAPQEEEVSGDKKLERKSAGYPTDEPYPTSGDGSIPRPEPRLGQDEDAAAWPFGDGNDDIDPKWGRTRDKLTKKKTPCAWI